MMLAAVWPRPQEKQLVLLARDYVRDLLTGWDNDGMGCE